MPTVNCAECKRKLQNKLFINCAICNASYDLNCTNISERRFNSMSTENKLNWKCHACLNKQKNIKKTITPTRVLSNEQSNISSDVFDHLDENAKDANEQCNYITEITLRKLLESFKKDMTNIIRTTVSEIVNEKFSIITKQITEFQESLVFFNNQLDDMKRQCDEHTSIIEALNGKYSHLHTTFNMISTRLNLAEQYLRESNIEINGIPEHRNENLPNCLLQLAKTVNAPLDDGDILHVTRVAKLDKQNNRPRAVVAKLRSPRQRDVLLAAIYNFNKKNPTSKLSTGHLGYAGERSPVFVAEHLTPANKQLHAETRQRAKEYNYKFTWVRNGRIYVRKDENTQAILIRCSESLKKIT